VPTYFPLVFDASNLDQAKKIILTPEGSTTEHRRETETPYLAELIKPGSASLILDYGCGIGRISKAFIERHGSSIVGLDINKNMRTLAPDMSGPTYDLFSQRARRDGH
jgi:tRNA1(Val) A37 N6-methylase TrmN6